MKQPALLFLIALLALSCTKESVRTAWSNQEASIDKFVKSQSGEAVYRGGSVRVILQAGTGEEGLKKNGTVSFYYAGYVFGGRAPAASALFATNREETANTSGWTLSDGSYDILTVNLGEADLVTGLKNGLVGVKEGEECYVLFSSKYGFGDRTVGTIPALSPLIYHLWVESISNE